MRTQISRYLQVDKSILNLFDVNGDSGCEYVQTDSEYVKSPFQLLWATPLIGVAQSGSGEMAFSLGVRPKIMHSQ